MLQRTFCVYGSMEWWQTGLPLKEGRGYPGMPAVNGGKRDEREGITELPTVPREGQRVLQPGQTGNLHFIVRVVLRSLKPLLHVARERGGIMPTGENVSRWGEHASLWKECQRMLNSTPRRPRAARSDAAHPARAAREVRGAHHSARTRRTRCLMRNP